MRALPKRYAVAAMAGMAAVSLAACGGSSSSSSTASSGKPVSGGTLHIVAASGPDHIDTVPAYYTPDYELERMYTRQLLSYPTDPATSTSSAGWTKDTTPVARRTAGVLFEEDAVNNISGKAMKAMGDLSAE